MTGGREEGKTNLVRIQRNFQRANWAFIGTVRQRGRTYQIEGGTRIGRDTS